MFEQKEELERLEVINYENISCGIEDDKFWNTSTSTKSRAPLQFTTQLNAFWCRHLLVCSILRTTFSLNTQELLTKPELPTPYSNLGTLLQHLEFCGADKEHTVLQLMNTGKT